MDERSDLAYLGFVAYGIAYKDSDSHYRNESKHEIQLFFWFYNITYNTLLDKRIYGMLVKLKERMDQIIFILKLSIWNFLLFLKRVQK